nr:MAG: major capsid protein [Microviridae sp.]
MNGNSKVYSHTGSIKPGRSTFDLSYTKTFTCDMGQLIPVMCDEVVPGDFIKLGNQCVIRFQPLVAPVLHEINVYTHYFFVPNRIMWNNATPDNWESFITGGADGLAVPTLPRWSPLLAETDIGSLWDYLGFPTTGTPGTPNVPAGVLPVDFPRRAYNMIYNAYYRDETLQTEVALTNGDILKRDWEKNYFASALPFQQRGTAPALPISGIVPIKGIGTTSQNFLLSGSSVYESGGTHPSYAYGRPVDEDHGADQGLVIKGTAASSGYPNITADLSSATTFNVADLRLAFQIQRWLERNARAGARYTEFLQSHFGVHPRDERLQRPEYIGGSKSPVIISEVLQTSESATTPQGTLAGHGISASNAYAGKYHVKEFGWIIGIMSIMPRQAYNSQGINRQFIKTTKYDYYFPEFAHLSEQAIFNGELVAKNGDATYNQGIFGYQGRYDELRTKDNITAGLMRTTFNYWHMARDFNVASPPALNASFIECVPTKRIFAVTTVPGLIVSFGNVIAASRPLPIMAEPGLIDHT